MKLLHPDSLSSILVDVLDIEYGSDVFYNVVYDTLHYIICHTKIKEYHTSLSDIVCFQELELSPAQFRLGLTENAYIIKNLKYYTAFLSLSNDITPNKAEDLACKYGVHACDAKWVQRCVESKSFVRHIKKYVRSKNLNKKQYSLQCYLGLSEEFGTMVKEVMLHSKRGVYKKLRFVTRYHNISPSEFTSELMCEVLKAFYQSKPNNMEPKHQLNYLKATSTTRILNMIDSYTSQKRQRLVNMGTDNKDGAKFVLTTVAESQLPTGTDGEVQSLESMGEGEHWLNGAEKQDFALSLDALLKRYGNKKRGEVVRIFTGMEVARFTAFLKDKRIIRTENKTAHDVLALKSHEEIKLLVSEYLNISSSSVDRALKECSHDLGL